MQEINAYTKEGADAEFVSKMRGDLNYAPKTHTQDISTINGLQLALDGKVNLSDLLKYLKIDQIPNMAGNVDANTLNGACFMGASPYGTTALNYPIDEFIGYIVGVQYNTNYKLQYAFTIGTHSNMVKSNQLNRSWWRTCRNGTWGPWLENDYVGRTWDNASSGVKASNLKNGWTFISSTTNAKAVDGYPFDGFWGYINTVVVSDTLKLQEAFSYGFVSYGAARATADGRFVRSTVDGIYGAWKQTHMTGQIGGGDIIGTGSPEGVVVAPVGCYYTDLNSTYGATRWHKTKGTAATGWRVVEGDTGWRNIGVLPDSKLINDFKLRRINETVYVSMLTTQGLSGSERTVDVPFGFRYAASYTDAGWATPSGAITTGAGGAYLNVTVSNPWWCYLSISHTTRDSWPNSTLPPRDSLTPSYLP